MTVTAFKVVEDFEQAVAEYTGAPYVVTTTSCTTALLLACLWYKQVKNPDYTGPVRIPTRTYVSVPMSVIHAGYTVWFDSCSWTGAYSLDPLPVWDSARWFTKDMYHRTPGEMVCLSFHATKILGDTQGGAILTDNAEAAEWLRRARFDGRTQGVAPKDDQITQIGYHCYMSPDVAARLLLRLHSLPEHNEALPNDDYPYLSDLPVFKSFRG